MTEELPGSFAITVDVGDVVTIRTPGGGGFGPPEEGSR